MTESFYELTKKGENQVQILTLKQTNKNEHPALDNLRSHLEPTQNLPGQVNFDLGSNQFTPLPYNLKPSYEPNIQTPPAPQNIQAAKINLPEDPRLSAIIASSQLNTQ